jgi:hypothetical protein
MIEYRIIQCLDRNEKTYFLVRRYLFGFIPWTYFKTYEYSYCGETSWRTKYPSLKLAEDAIEEYRKHLEWHRKPKKRIVNEYVYSQGINLTVNLPLKKTCDDRLDEAIQELGSSPQKSHKEIAGWLKELKKFREGGDV